MFPSDQVPSLAPAVMVIGAARAEPSAVTGSIMSTTMSWQVPLPSFCLEKSLLHHHVSLNHHDGLPLPHFVYFLFFPVTQMLDLCMALWSLHRQMSLLL